MAASVIGALRVNLGLDSAQFTRGTSQVQRRLQTMRRQFMVVAGAAAALGSAITAMALRGAADIDRIAKAARRIDGTAGAFQALELAAGEAGVSISSLTNDLQTLNRELASNSAGAQRALSRLSLSAEDLLSLDADERVAVIADRIRDMGLSAADATVILRDLGVRNREMALMMIQGGAAIRGARDDIRDYGLEIDDALAGKVENARDQIGRLTVVTQYLGQRLAAEIVPALGRFARAITDSMREGGLLRRALDLLIDNMQRLVTIVGTAVAFFGVRYVAAMVAARVATFTLVGALAALKTAMVRTGIGAFIVGLGVLINYFIRLRAAGASWGESLVILGDIAVETWRGIMTSAEAIRPALAAVWHGVRADFLNMLADMADAFQGWLQDFGKQLMPLRVPPGFGGIAGIAGDALQNARGGDRLRGAAERARADSNIAAGRRDAIGEVAFDGARKAVARLNEVLSRNIDDTSEAADEARKLADEISRLAGEGGGSGGGGGGARAAAAAIDGLTDSVETLHDATQQVESSFENAFVSFVTGAQSARQAISNLLRDLARLAAQSAFRGLMAGTGGFGSLIGGFFGGAPTIAGARADGGPVMAGRTYLVGERGPEFFTPGSSGQIIPNGGAGQLVIRLDLSSDVEARIMQNTSGQAVEIVREYDRSALPGRVRQISRDPRARG